MACWNQAMIWTNAGILLIVPLVTNFSEILIGIYTFAFMKVHLKMTQNRGHFVSASIIVVSGQLRDGTDQAGRCILAGPARGNMSMYFYLTK